MRVSWYLYFHLHHPTRNRNIVRKYILFFSERGNTRRADISMFSDDVFLVYSSVEYGEIFRFFTQFVCLMLRELLEFIDPQSCTSRANLFRILAISDFIGKYYPVSSEKCSTSLGKSDSVFLWKYSMFTAHVVGEIYEHFLDSTREFVEFFLREFLVCFSNYFFSFFISHREEFFPE
jgi:hypothetical protein